LLVKLTNAGALLLSGDAVHFQSNWQNRRVPAMNIGQELKRAVRCSEPCANRR